MSQKKLYDNQQTWILELLNKILHGHARTRQFFINIKYILLLNSHNNWFKTSIWKHITDRGSYKLL